MTVYNFNFTFSNDEIQISNSAFRTNLLKEQMFLILTNLSILLVAILPTLVRRLFSKRPRIFQIYNNQLNSRSFLPFNYLIVIHLDKELISLHNLNNLNLNSKFRFELISPKMKRTINFSVPFKYLIVQSYLPIFILKIYRYFYYLIKFLSCFCLTSLDDKEICFLIHRRKILEHITSIRVDIELLLDLKIYLHGLTVYSFNSNFAYYLPFESYIRCSSSLPTKGSSKKSVVSNPTQSDSIHHDTEQIAGKQQIESKDLKLFCDFFDLFSPNYFQKCHPYYGCSIDFIYCKISKKLIKWIPRTLQENIAPINRQTSVQLELFYLINLGTQILANSKVEKLTDENPEQIRGVLTGNPIKFRETFVFYLFNLSLLLFTLLFGLNALIENQKPELISLLPVIFISSLFSLLSTEFVLNFYYLYIKRHNKFVKIKLYQNSFKQEFINFTFFFFLNLSTVSLFIWSTTLAVVIKQHTSQSNYLAYKFGFAVHFLNLDQTNQNDFISNLKVEILFLLIIYYLSLLIMFRLWTFIINLIRLIFVNTVQLYHNKVLRRFMGPKRKIRALQLESILSIKEEERQEKPKKIKNANRSIDEEMERNLLRYFTKK